jgi:hypothetical protein
LIKLVFINLFANNLKLIFFPFYEGLVTAVLCARGDTDCVSRDTCGRLGFVVSEECRDCLGKGLLGSGIKGVGPIGDKGPVWAVGQREWVRKEVQVCLTVQVTATVVHCTVHTAGNANGVTGNS